MHTQKHSENKNASDSSAIASYSKKKVVCIGLSSAAVCLVSLIIPYGICLLVDLCCKGFDTALLDSIYLLTSSSVVISCAVILICEPLAMLAQADGEYLFPKHIASIGLALPLILAIVVVLFGACLYSSERYQDIFLGLSVLRGNSSFAIGMVLGVIAVSLLAGYNKMVKYAYDAKHAKGEYDE